MTAVCDRHQDAFSSVFDAAKTLARPDENEVLFEAHRRRGDFWYRLQLQPDLLRLRRSGARRPRSNFTELFVPATSEGLGEFLANPPFCVAATRTFAGVRLSISEPTRASRRGKQPPKVFWLGVTAGDENMSFELTEAEHAQLMAALAAV